MTMPYPILSITLTPSLKAQSGGPFRMPLPVMMKPSTKCKPLLFSRRDHKQTNKLKAECPLLTSVMERSINPLIIVIISIQLLSVAGEERSTLLRESGKTQSTKGSRYRVTLALCQLPSVPQKTPLSPHLQEPVPTKA